MLFALNSPHYGSECSAALAHATAGPWVGGTVNAESVRRLSNLSLLPSGIQLATSRRASSFQMQRGRLKQMRADPHQNLFCQLCPRNCDQGDA
jgi:hypothetical protein